MRAQTQSANGYLQMMLWTDCGVCELHNDVVVVRYRKWFMLC